MLTFLYYNAEQLVININLSHKSLEILQSLNNSFEIKD
jgi:hypothetical protein